MTEEEIKEKLKTHDANIIEKRKGCYRKISSSEASIISTLLRMRDDLRIIDPNCDYMLNLTKDNIEKIRIDIIKKAYENQHEISWVKK